MQIGDYTILKELKKSPFGSLSLAEHAILKRKVALKFLSPSLFADEKALKQFEKEIPALAGLDHPHVIRLQDVGFHEKGCFLVYDWISPNEEPLPSLADDLDRGNEEKLFAIAEQLASALDFMHQSNPGGTPVAHLGIKASNVLIKTVNGKISAHLSDTGLFRLVSPKILLSRLLQISLGQASPSDAFWIGFYGLAPEQKRAFSENFSSSKADAYALGVLLYERLSGRLPEGRCPPLSELVPGLSYRWDPFISACLDPDPSRRPENLSEALAASIQSKAPSSQTQSAEPSPLQLQLNRGEIYRPQFEADPGAVFQTESAVIRYKPAEKETKTIEPLFSDMVIIPGGEFFRGSMQGSRDESPRHPIRLSHFAVDIHPVTNEQFVRFLDVMGGEKDGNNNDIIRLKDSRIKRLGGSLNIESGYSKHPVVGVTWYGAYAYAKWVGKRLPSEAEWEAAALGGVDEVAFPTGEDLDKSGANFFSSDTTPVMNYSPNPYGLYDMAGNVYEWCMDWYDYHYYEQSRQEPNNPKGPAQGVYRILRGGCWKSLKEDLRCSHRHRNNPGTVNGTYGFRCAADVASAP